MNFNELGLDEDLLRAVSDLGFEEPTEIQQKAIPTLLAQNNDLVGLAQTGTGKTAAFGLPLLHKVDANVKKVQGLILSPTRELCVQIADDLTKFSKYKKVKNVAIYGGASIEQQIQTIKRGVQVIVATPGRLNDLIKRGRVDLSDVQIAILDEADEMLNMGFKDELDRILSETPSTKNTWLFSATMPKEVRRIASSYMDSPDEISAGEKNVTNKNIEHQYVIVNSRTKYEALKRVLDFNTDIFAVIFCRTKRDTQEVADQLTADGYNSDALHGDLSQAQRDRVMKKFRDRNLSILVATDVAARGIDVNDVTHVIHHQLPEEVENYTHRSGRTARAGKTGISVALVIKRDTYKIGQLEKITGAKFTELKAPTAEEICEKKLMSFSKELNETEIDSSVEKHSEKLFELFQEVSKEDLIKKIASSQMKELLSYYDNKNDLTAEGGEGHSNPNADRFFVNLGKLDGLDDAQLKDVLGDMLGLEKESVGSIDIKDSFSFFEYKKGGSKEVLGSSGKVDFNGRTIRIEESSSRPSGRGGSRGGRRDGGGGRGKGGFGGGGNRGARRDGGGGRRDGGGFRGKRENSAGGSDRAPRSSDRDRSSSRGTSERSSSERSSSERGSSSERRSSSSNRDTAPKTQSKRRGSGASDFGFLDSSLTY